MSWHIFGTSGKWSYPSVWVESYDYAVAMHSSKLCASKIADSALDDFTEVV